MTRPLHISELVDSHTEFAGPRGLYTAFFVFTMNKSAYDALPDDLKKVIDDNSGLELSRKFGIVMDEGDEQGRKIAAKRGNDIVTFDPEEIGRWKAASEPVVADWVSAIDAKGIEAQAMIDDAKAMIAKYADE